MNDQTLDARVEALEGAIASERPPLPPYVDRGGKDYPLSASEVKGIADELIRQGVDPDRVRLAALAAGAPAFEADTRTSDQRAYDQIYAPAKPSDYRIRYYQAGDTKDPAALVEFNSQATSWLSEVGFHRSAGEALVEDAIASAAKLKVMSPVQRDAWASQQGVTLGKVASSRGTTVEAMRKVAGQVIDFGGKSRFGDLMRGALADSQIVLALVLQGERIAYRGNLRK